MVLAVDFVDAETLDPLLTSAGSHVTPEARSLNLRLGGAFLKQAFAAAQLTQGSWVLHIPDMPL